MRRMVSMLVLATVPICAPALSLGDWFGKKGGEAAETNVVRRYHLLITSKADEKDLVQMMTAKRLVTEEMRVLLALTEEKKQELVRFDQELKEKFAIVPERTYHYDPRSKTIFDQTLKPGVTNVTAGVDPETVFDRKLHKVLKGDEEIRLFASLAMGKRMTQEELGVFARVLREKQMELGRVEKGLKDKFSMSRDRNYWYDAATMRLYELVAPARQGAVKQDTP